MFQVEKKTINYWVTIVSSHYQSGTSQDPIFSVGAISHLSSVDMMINMRMGAGSLKKWSTFHHHHRLGHHHSPSGDWLTNYRWLAQVQHQNINPTETFRPQFPSLFRRQKCYTVMLDSLSKTAMAYLSYHIKYQYVESRNSAIWIWQMTNRILNSLRFKLILIHRGKK